VTVLFRSLEFLAILIEFKLKKCKEIIICREMKIDAARMDQFGKRDEVRKEEE